MKKYSLAELDLNEKGGTFCHECPLQDDEGGECSKRKTGINKHLYEAIDCTHVVVKLKPPVCLSLYYKRLSCITGVVALGLMLKLFVTSQQSPVEGAIQLLLMCCSSLSLVVSLFGKKLDEIGK
jgi:hypothetical protein